MRPVRGVATGLLLLVGCQGRTPDWATLRQEIRTRFPAVSQISAAELEREHPDALLVDVRSPEEYAVSHLPGAVRATTPEEVRAALAGSGAHEVVLYCSVGWRSSELAQRIDGSLGVPVHDLEGSIFAWANAGRPLERDGRPAHEVHPFDATWGRLLDERYHPR